MNINTIQAAAEIAKTLRDGSLTAKENLEDNLLGILGFVIWCFFLVIFFVGIVVVCYALSQGFIL